MSGVVAVIPARLDSSRLPNKVLCDLGGAPMIARVIERVGGCSAIDQILVATDAEEIERAVQAYPVTVVRTGQARSGTDRVAQAISRSGLQPDMILNVQADEPFIDPDLLGRMVEVHRATGCAMVTACAPLSDRARLRSPSVVKVVPDALGRALLFSRAPVPWPGPGGLHGEGALPPGVKAWEHLGVYGFTAEGLRRFAALPPHPLEVQESLEQLRALAHGWVIELVEASEAHGGVDTPLELESARARFLREIHD